MSATMYQMIYSQLCAARDAAQIRNSVTCEEAAAAQRRHKVANAEWCALDSVCRTLRQLCEDAHERETIPATLTETDHAS